MRINMTREFYIPKSDTLQTIADGDYSDAIAYTYEAAGALYGLAFHGKARKPDWHYRFKSEEARAAKIEEHASNRRARIAYMEKRRAEKAAVVSRLDVGSILVASWGYDQTNLDWYQVTAKIGARMIELREIGAESQETGFMCGNASAIKDKFTGEAFRRLANGDGVKIDDCRRAYLWDGRPHHWSSYA